eukprot:3508272-Rhodomonas_salina.1
MVSANLDGDASSKQQTCMLCIAVPAARRSGAESRGHAGVRGDAQAQLRAAARHVLGRGHRCAQSQGLGGPQRPGLSPPRCYCPTRVLLLAYARAAIGLRACCYWPTRAVICLCALLLAYARRYGLMLEVAIGLRAPLLANALGPLLAYAAKWPMLSAAIALRLPEAIA